MKKSIACFVSVVFCLFVAGLLLVGCEVEPVNSPVSITPDAAAVRPGGHVTLTASGGYEYEWSLENETWGKLNTRHGPTVTYTSLYAPSTNSAEVQVVTVTSTITGVPSSSTNTTAYSVTAEAYITHMP